jgi:hypothetical protein
MHLFAATTVGNAPYNWKFVMSLRLEDEHGGMRQVTKKYFSPVEALVN